MILKIDRWPPNILLDNYYTKWKQKPLLLLRPSTGENSTSLALDIKYSTFLNS